MKNRFTIIAFLITAINIPLQARDIDLDGIYLKKDSTLYSQVSSVKEKNYKDISSILIDSSVIYGCWISGEEILYIKELANQNSIYIFNKNSGKKKLLYRFNGTVTFSDFKINTGLLAIKYIFISDEGSSVSKDIFIDSKTSEVKEAVSFSLFQNYNLSGDSRSIVIAKKDGIYKYDPFAETNIKILDKKSYEDLSCSDNPVLLNLSPDKSKKIISCGSGGDYNAKLLSSSRVQPLKGLTSNKDIFWIGNDSFIYRSGAPGDYSIKLYDINKNSTISLITDTMNPDIKFFEQRGLLAGLDNQMIVIMDLQSKQVLYTGIEGEEINFSPDGRKFLSIYRGNSYVTNISLIEKYNISLRRNAQSLLSLYNKALSEKAIWENDFSREYLSKKILLYKKYLGNESKHMK
jgi:hypothetical protein